MNYSIETFNPAHQRAIRSGGRYIGADIARYEQSPGDAQFVRVNLNCGQVALHDEAADAVVAMETIEHLENPRAFFVIVGWKNLG